jgi:hypothetical protein
MSIIEQAYCSEIFDDLNRFYGDDNGHRHGPCRRNGIHRPSQAADRWVEARTNLLLLPRPKIYISDAALLRLTAAGTDRGAERIASYRDGAIFISERYW